MSHPGDTNHYQAPPAHMAPPQPAYYGQAPAAGYQALPGQYPGGMPAPTVVHMAGGGGGCPVCKG